MTSVRFLTDVRLAAPYRKGEVVSFDDAVAFKLIDRGLVEPTSVYGPARPAKP